MSLSNQQKRNLAFGAILSYYNNEPILDIKSKEKKENHKKQLNLYWEVYDHNSALKRLERLLNLENSLEIDFLLKQSDSKINKIKETIADKLGIQISEVEVVKSTYAWDICRFIVLAKWCYWSGYISSYEMWNFTIEGTEKASSIGENWNEYTISFLLGRTIQGFEMEPIVNECKELFHSKRSIKSWFLGVKDINIYKKYNFK